MVATTKSHSHHKNENKFNRLSLLVICLILTVVVTIFSIWVNLKNYSKDDISQGLFTSIGERFQQGLESNGFISNL